MKVKCILQEQEKPTAYETAVKGGYTGAEEQFNSMIASGPWLKSNRLIADSYYKSLSLSTSTTDGLGWYRIAKTFYGSNTILFVIQTLQNQTVSGCTVGIASMSYGARCAITILQCTDANQVKKLRITRTDFQHYNLDFFYSVNAINEVMFSCFNIASNIPIQNQEMVKVEDNPAGETLIKEAICFFNNTTNPASYANAGSHRSIYRGAFLGNAVTAQQLAAIGAGTFDDLYIGDYWVINSIYWRIADIDYWYGVGDTPFNKHHVVIMPDSGMYAYFMNPTRTTEGGYVNSKMRTNNLASAKTTIQNAFGNAVLTHREIYVSSISNGLPSSASWFDSDVDLPSEIMIYGCRIYAPGGNGAYPGPMLNVSSKTQLALMQMYPLYINPSSQTYWLVDANNEQAFSVVQGQISAISAFADNPNIRVRPVFAIGQPS